MSTGIAVPPALPKALPSYLADLHAHNARDWFEAHRESYETLWLRPALDLAAALSGPAAALGLTAVPKLNASVRRINRDVRFSTDKAPYHTRLHLILSTGPTFNKGPGVHLIVSERGFGFGAGHYGIPPDALARIRAAFCEPEEREAFLRLLARVAGQGAELTPPDLAKVPKGLPSGADWDHLLCRKHLVARTPDHRPHPDWLFTADCVPSLIAIVADLAPFALWLARFSA